MAFLHGVETIEVQSGARPISVVKSAVVGLVGIAPKGDINTPTVVLNPTQADQFGQQVPGFTIPQALDAIFAQGAGTVIVVNVFDPDTMTAAVTAESLTITGGKASTSFAPIGDVTLTNSAGSTTFDVDVDYTIDDFGNIQVLDYTAIAEGSTVKATYDKLDASTITAADIIGTITAGVRSGFKCFEEAYTLFGYTPKIFISPSYCELDGVAAEMIVQADLYRGRAIIDAPVGELPEDVISARGPSGTLAGFQTSDKRVILVYPYVKVYDPVTDANVNRSFSQYLAGVIAATDNAEGYWVSPSNHEIKGIVGMERPITAQINNPQTEANQLNEVGIVTLFNSFGSGIRVWGNRTASWPSSTAPDNFIPVGRVADILHESVEYAMLQFIDRPINQALIDAIRESVNAFIRVLVGRGAVVDGVCTYDPAKNPPVELAAGHLTFDITFMPPTPAERITFESFIDINLLKFE
jgi:uncharacterized protein